MSARPDVITARVTLYTRVLFVGVVALMVLRIVQHVGDGRWAAASLVGGYLAWLAVEVKVTFSKPAEPVTEVRTILAYATARMLVIVASILPSVALSGVPWWLPVTVVLFVGGIALRTIAIRHLAAQYTHHVVRRSEHVVVSTGPYRFVRHPAYAGMLLANLGFALSFASPASLAAFVVLTGVLIWRIRTEERAMWSVPGYPEFATGRARLVAGVW
jgi:protein-S-isoprenylcysteine O-methyltransferase Ste14